jgi:hypothetical protein
MYALKRLTTVAAATALLVGGTATLAAAPAFSASHSVPSSGVSSGTQRTAADEPSAVFYTGLDLTGDASTVDLTQTGVCKTLPKPADSARNYSINDIEVFFNPNCQKGTPGSSSDIMYVLGSLHEGNLPYPAVSYRVRR